MFKFCKIYMIQIILFGLILSLCSSVFADEKPNYSYKKFEPFKIVFLPDIHLSFTDQKDKILYKESFVIFQDVIKTLSTKIKPDFAIFGGDLTHNVNGDFADLSLFIDSASDLRTKFYAILGDREANLSKNFSKENFIKEFDEFSETETFWTAEPVDNVLLIGLDSSIEGEQEGYINIHQLFWLDNVLKNNRDKFTIIALHHSPLITCDQDKNVWKKYTLREPDLFLELINLYPQVKVILSGHHFSNYTQVINEKLFIGHPSIAVYPNTYKILEIHPDKVLVDNRKISFKQIIEKGKEHLINSEYATEYNAEKPKAVIKYQKGDKFSRQKKYYFSERERSRFLRWF